MNAGRRGKGLGESDPSRNKLLGALGHVHNPFSTNSHRDHDSDDYSQDDNFESLRTMSLQLEITKAEAILTAQNLVARIQKS